MFHPPVTRRLPFGRRARAGDFLSVFWRAAGGRSRERAGGFAAGFSGTCREKRVSLRNDAVVAKWADAPDLGSGDIRRAGSSPVDRTKPTESEAVSVGRGARVLFLTVTTAKKEKSRQLGETYL